MGAPATAQPPARSTQDGPQNGPVEAPLLPGGSPLMGHLAFLSEDPIRLLAKARDEVGDIVRLRLANKPAFFVFDPAAVEQILVTKVDTYVKDTRGYHKLALLLGQGLVTSSGEYWLRQRRIAQPAFRRKCLDSFAEVMARYTTQTHTAWRELAAEGAEFDVNSALMAFALQVAGVTLFSSDMGELHRVLGPDMETFLHHFNRLISSPLPFPEYWPLPKNVTFWRSTKRLHRFVDGLIAERRASGEDQADLLGLFMATKDPETGEGMSDRQLRDEALTALLAGHETTANALTWTLYQLAQNPEVADRLAAELKAASEGDAPLSVQAVMELPYLKQVINESLRLYPPVWILARMAVEDDDLVGFSVPKGAYLFVSPQAIHRHPKLWDAPETFDPDRFAPDGPQPGRYAFFPFSRGKRQCIGDRFAMMEMMVFLGHIARDFRFTVPEDSTLEIEASVTLRPRHGLMLQIQAR